MHIPDEGEILLDGRPVRFRNPMEARREGIECCYQDLAVAPAMTIAENLFLGQTFARAEIPAALLAELFSTIPQLRKLGGDVSYFDEAKAKEAEQPAAENPPKPASGG